MDQVKTQNMAKEMAVAHVDEGLSTTNEGLRIGVWIDLREAVIISLRDGTAEVKKVECHTDKHKRILQSRNSGSWFGDHFINDEKKQLGRQRKEMQDYLGRVIRAIGRPDRLVIFGPAQAKRDLLKAVGTMKPPLACTELTTGPMSRNQKVAWVKRYFAR